MKKNFSFLFFILMNFFVTQNFVFSQSEENLFKVQLEENVTLENSNEISIEEKSENSNSSLAENSIDENLENFNTENSSNEDFKNSNSNSESNEKNLERKITIPEKKRPLKPDAEKVAAAEKKDEGKKAISDKRDTINYGIETEIVDFIKSLIDSDDPRFSEDLYDLFYVTKNVAVREKIIEYFTKQKDPCIEDFAVEILSDPYDTKNSTVELLFKYVSEVKTKEAVPCVLNLLETEDEKYFSGALSAIGQIGGEEEAAFLVEYLSRDDLSVNQRQSLMKVLGNLKAVSTWEKLCEICQDDDENTFVRMYAAEAIGNMKKEESIPILLDLFENSDPNFRVYVIKGLVNFPENKDVQSVILQGIKDAHWKVRQESILSCEMMKLKSAIPFIIYRAKNDPEKVIKDKSYEVLAKLNDSKSNEFLISQITDEKATDVSKNKSAEVLLKFGDSGFSEIAELALKVVNDDKKKPLRYNIGKLIAKKSDSAFEKVCVEYLNSKDSQTCSLGLDMFVTGRYNSAKPKVEEIAENTKAGNNQKRARKILKLDD